jgi:hypothetical protein
MLFRRVRDPGTLPGFRLGLMWKDSRTTGVDFQTYLPLLGVSVLTTLHLYSLLSWWDTSA